MCIRDSSEEGYYIRITEKLEERAATNRYSIRPDLFLIGKNSSWEIYAVSYTHLVITGKNRQQEEWQEKVNQIRCYNGEKFELADCVQLSLIHISFIQRNLGGNCNHNGS